MNKIIIKICQVIIVIILLFGILVLGLIGHELTHFYDVIKQNETVTSVCFLRLPINETTHNLTSGRIAEVMHTGIVDSPEKNAWITASIVAIILLIISAIGLWGEESR